MTLLLGELIDQKYRIIRLLGNGGMGSVYEAENVRVNRRVAIKVMHQVRQPEDIARFEREARAAQIGSPHIVQVFDLGYLSDASPYMVMEYLAGESLGQRLKKTHHLHAAELLPIAKQILDALTAAHRAGIVHRDLKPDNVFLTRSEGNTKPAVKLLDFGVSKFTATARHAGDVALTRSGVAVGTPHYMSPEQIQGSKTLDARSDLYSLGVICYRCLSGQFPFESQDIAPLLVRVLLEDPPFLHHVAPAIDVELSRIVARALARRASARLQSAAEFRAALVEWERTHGHLMLTDRANTGGPPAAHSSSHLGVTNPTWSSTAGGLPLASRSRRNPATAALMLLLVLGGGVAAYESFKPSVHTTVRDSAVPGVLDPTAAAPITTPTVLATPADVRAAVMPSSSQQQAKPEGSVRSELARPRAAETGPIRTAPTSIAPTSNGASAEIAPSGVTTSAPDAALPNADEGTTSYRHVSRGVSQ